MMQLEATLLEQTRQEKALSSLNMDEH